MRRNHNGSEKVIEQAGCCHPAAGYWLAAGVFGVLGLVGGGGTDPYEARKSVVMVYSYLQLTDGQSAGAMGTGFAIGKPGEPVEYIVTNGHVVGIRLYGSQSICGASIFGRRAGILLCSGK